MNNTMAAQTPNNLMFAPSANSVNLPQYVYEKCKWAVLRTFNVDDLARQFMAQPNKVCIFEDKKLARTPLVMLRKEQFEITVKLLEDLQNGEAAVRHNIQTLFHTVKLVQNLTSKLPNLPDYKDDIQNLQEAVHILSGISGQISSTYILATPSKKMEPYQLSEEDRELITPDEE